MALRGRFCGAEAKLQGLEQKITKLQEEISKLTKDKAVRDKQHEKASKHMRREQYKKVDSKFPCFLLIKSGSF